MNITTLFKMYFNHHRCLSSLKFVRHIITLMRLKIKKKTLNVITTSVGPSTTILLLLGCDITTECHMSLAANPIGCCVSCH